VQSLSNLAVEDHDLHVFHGAAGQSPLGHGVARAFLARRNELGGDVGAHTLVHEDEPFVALFGVFVVVVARLDVAHDAGKLTAAARLLLVQVVEFGFAVDGFLVGHLFCSLEKHERTRGKRINTQ